MAEPETKQEAPPEGLVGHLFGIVERLVFSPPSSWREGLWRLCSIASVSSMIASAYLAWRYPEVLRSVLLPESAPIARRLAPGRDLTQGVMQSIAAFVRAYRPEHLALVSLPTATTSEVIWSTGGHFGWATPLGGTLSLELAPAMGRLVFGECWSGALDGSGTVWTICPIADDRWPRGLVIASWKQPAAAAEGRPQLAILARRLQALLY